MFRFWILPDCFGFLASQVWILPCCFSKHDQVFLWLTRSCVCLLLGWLNKLVSIQFWRHQVQYGYFFTLYYFMKILGLFLFLLSHVLRHSDCTCTIALTVTFTNPNTCALFDHMPARWHTWAFPSSPLASWDRYFLATIPDASGHPTTNWSVSDVFFHLFFVFISDDFLWII